MSIKVAGVAHIGVPVRDMERSLRFYRDLLGLTLLSRREVSGERVSQGVQVPGARIDIALLDAGNTKIELLHYLEPPGRSFDRLNNDVGSAHLTFEVEDIRATYDQLQEAGIVCHTEPFPTTIPEGWGWFYARDPDNMTVEFNGPL